MQHRPQLTVLVAPLDWGLGHATRCIPIINCLLNEGCKVIIAAAGKNKVLLQNEFPVLEIVELKGYQITYSKSKIWLPFKLLLQLPKLIGAIQKEKRWLKGFVRKNKVDIVVSDNRFGLQTSKAKCIFITHQLQIKAPVFFEGFLRRINYSFINKFAECWVPDVAGNRNIAGVLAHPKALPLVPVKYIGALCRLQKKQAQPVQYKWLVILSGPEPQRAILENTIIAASQKIEGKICMVRAMPGNNEKIETPPNLESINYAGTEQLEMLLAQSEYVLSRSGYTTVMEMLALQKKCLFIPTPGQTEQQYLAKHLVQQKWAFACKQNDDIVKAMQAIEAIQFVFPTFESRLEETVKALLTNVKL